MLKELFGHPVEKGFQLAKQVDKKGRAVVCTTSLERAELKQEQIHAYGPDPRHRAVQGLDDGRHRAGGVRMTGWQGEGVTR